MHRPSRPVRRLLLVPALLLSLVLAGSVPAAAYAPPNDSSSGQIAHYDFRDYSYRSHDGNVRCDYHEYGNGQRRIDGFELLVPYVWWYDNDSDTTHEHGTVGWRYRIQESSDPATVAFATVYSSSVQQHTAHEDHPGYSDGDRAPFTTRHLDWSNGHTVYYRIKYTIYWYRSNGTLKGQLDHWYDLYQTDSGATPAMGACRNKWYIEIWIRTAGDRAMRVRTSAR